MLNKLVVENVLKQPQMTIITHYLCKIKVLFKENVENEGRICNEKSLKPSRMSTSDIVTVNHLNFTVTFIVID